MSRKTVRLLIVAFMVLMLPSGAFAACRSPGEFQTWLKEFQADAQAKGLSAATVSNLSGLRYDASIVARDRAQGVFAQSFLEFSGRMVSKYRLSTGKASLSKRSALFNAIEQKFGVPGAVLVAFWGLETDFGANTGDLPTLNSLATLAFDCRRSELFSRELLAALRLIERGDLKPAEMRGPWAGELGQVQFLPSYYAEHAVDFDGDGHPNLLKSAPDALASAANLLKHFGWQAGEPWLVEVMAPEDLPWENADVAVVLPVSQWDAWGVRRIGGGALPAGDKASLVLPMGRNGPAFLAYPNFQAFLKWNQSLVYATTAAYFATRLDGAPQVSTGRGEVESFSAAQIKALQAALARKGFDTGGSPDGRLGLKTRAAVRKAQLEAGLPADGYPSAALLAWLR
jgi:lytic murein transglycosylase